MDLVGQREPRCVESGAEDDRVDRVVLAGGVDDAVLADFCDSVRDQRDIGLVKGAQVVIGNEDAFAAEAVVGQQLCA
jgi:hypothetical protein